MIRQYGLYGISFGSLNLQSGYASRCPCRKIQTLEEREVLFVISANKNRAFFLTAVIAPGMFVTFEYLNMDAVVRQSKALSKKIKGMTR